MSIRLSIAVPVALIVAAAVSLLPARDIQADPIETVSFTAIADTYVDQSAAGSNFGSSTTIEVDGNSGAAQEGLILFDIAGLSGPVVSAYLRVAVTNGTTDGPLVFPSDPSWLESSVTWDLRPTLAGPAVANAGAISSGGWYEFDVTAAVVGDGSLSLTLVPESSNGLGFDSRERASSAPQLVVSYDAVPGPQTTITSAPPTYTQADSAQFEFDASVAGATFECDLDGAGWQTCSSPHAYAGLPIGSHDFAVRATDPTGLIDTTPATYHWTIDRTPPSTVLLAPLDGAVEVATLSPVSAVYNEALDPASVNASALTLRAPGGGLVPGVVDYDATTFEVRFLPASPLALTTAYDATASGLRDLAGNPAPSVSWSFTTTSTPLNIRPVPGEYATIQAAIDSAVDGDIVLLAPGSYTESVFITNKAITLASNYYLSGDPADIAATVLTDDGVDDAITILNSGSVYTAVVGLTIAGSQTPEIDGVRSDGSLVLLANRISGFKDAVDIDPMVAPIADCDCRGNEITGNVDDALDLDGATTGTYAGNILSNNRGDGVEIRLNAYSAGQLPLHFYDNDISGNRSDGIQLIDEGGSAARLFVIERNLFANNGDAGIGLMDNGETTEDFRAASLLDEILLFDNTFNGNDYGVTGGDRLVALNNVFSGTRYIAVKGVDGDSIVAHSLFFANGTDSSGSNLDASTLIFADPQLDAAFVPVPGSPAIDAGVAAYSWDGRLVLDRAPGEYAGAAPDLGAFETDSGGPDTTPPDTFLTAGPDSETSQTSAAFAFSASEAGATFECRLDGAAWVPCASPQAYEPLPDGAHVFEVRATDAAGNVDATPATWSWVVDTVPPPPPTIVEPSDGSLHGPGPIAFAGTAEPDTTVELFEGALSAGETNADASGTWSLSVSGVPDGIHVYTAVASDAAGNVSQPSGVTITVDGAPPETTIVSGPASFERVATATFGFTSSEAASSFECRLDGGAWLSCVSPHSYGTLSEATHVFDVRATDSSGSTDPSPASATWTVDLTAPGLLSTDPVDGGEGVDPAVVVRATFDEPIDPATVGGSTFRLAPGGGGTAVIASVSYDVASHTASLTPAAPLSAGSSYVATLDGVQDRAGNPLALASWSFTTSAAPSVVSFAPVADAYVEASRPATNYGDATTLISDGGSQPKEALLRFDVGGIGTNVTQATLRVFLSNGSWNGPELALSSTAWSESDVTWETRPGPLTGIIGDVGSVSSGTWLEYDVTSVVAGQGTYSFLLSSVSSDGTKFNSREAPANWPELVIRTDGGADTNPPETVMLVTPPAVTNDTTATFEFTALEPGASFECRLDAAVWEACVSPSSYASLETGAHVFEVRAIDTAGNVDPTPAGHAWNVLPGSTLVFAADADAYVDERRSSSNFGSSTTLISDGGSGVSKETLVRFQVSGVSAPVVSVTLRIFVSNSSWNGPEVFAVGSGWDEQTVNWDLRPAVTSGALADAGGVAAGDWYEFDLTGAVEVDGTYSFLLRSTSTDATKFDSREGGRGPELVITTD